MCTVAAVASERRGASLLAVVGRTVGTQRHYEHSKYTRDITHLTIHQHSILRSIEMVIFTTRKWIWHMIDFIDFSYHVVTAAAAAAEYLTAVVQLIFFIV